MNVMNFFAKTKNIHVEENPVMQPWELEGRAFVLAMSGFADVRQCAFNLLSAVRQLSSLMLDDREGVEEDEADGGDSRVVDVVAEAGAEVARKARNRVRGVHRSQLSSGVAADSQFVMSAVLGDMSRVGPSVAAPPSGPTEIGVNFGDLQAIAGDASTHPRLWMACVGELARMLLSFCPRVALVSLAGKTHRHHWK